MAGANFANFTPRVRLRWQPSISRTLPAEARATSEEGFTRRSSRSERRRDCPAEAGLAGRRRIVLFADRLSSRRVDRRNTPGVSASSTLSPLVHIASRLPAQVARRRAEAGAEAAVEIGQVAEAAFEGDGADRQ